MAMAEICEKCGCEVRGDFEVYSRDTARGYEIVVDSTPDRNYNVCDSCNMVVCFSCSTYPESGYCDDCIKEYQLEGYLRDVGLIRSS